MTNLPRLQKNNNIDGVAKVNSSKSVMLNGLSQKKIGKIQKYTSITCNLLQEPRTLDEHTALFTVEFLSNWGNPTCLKLSAIWFMDNSKTYIKPKSITSYPKIDKNKLKLICRRLLPDLTQPEIFTQNWPLEDACKLSVVFAFAPDQLPTFIRFWNPRESIDCSVRNIIIRSGTDMLWQGEIPKGFVKDIHLPKIRKPIKNQKSEEILSSLFPILLKPEEIRKDQYGIYPNFRTDKISLEITSIYNPSYDSFGLNALQFFDSNFLPITEDAVMEIFLENCKIYNNPMLLIKNKPEINDYRYMFVAYSDFEVTPKITIKFKNSTLLSHVVVWNYNAYNSDYGICVKDIKLRSMKKLVWSGRIRQGNGFLKNAAAFSTTIWLTDIPKNEN